MRIEPTIAGASIVLVGNFNPAILAPDWFVRQGLVKEQAVIRDDPDLIIHPQIAQFKLDWCRIVTEPSKFSISGAKDPLVQLMDLTVRTFGEFLSHTPVRQLGINRYVHFPVESVEARDKIGQRLAPPEAWGDWSGAIITNAGSKRGGMRSLTMEQQVFDYERTGYIRTTVQPSSLLPSGLGVFVEVNDHYEVAATDALMGTQKIISILKENFEPSRAYADGIIDQVMKLAQ